MIIILNLPPTLVAREKEIIKKILMQEKIKDNEKNKQL